MLAYEQLYGVYVSNYFDNTVQVVQSYSMDMVKQITTKAEEHRRRAAKSIFVDILFYDTMKITTAQEKILGKPRNKTR